MLKLTHTACISNDNSAIASSVASHFSKRRQPKEVLSHVLAIRQLSWDERMSSTDLPIALKNPYPLDFTFGGHVLIREQCALARALRGYIYVVCCINVRQQTLSSLYRYTTDPYSRQNAFQVAHYPLPCWPCSSPGYD